MEASDDRVRIVNCNGPDIRQRLNLGRNNFALFIRQAQAQLAHTSLDCIPARQAGGKVDISRQAKVGGIENLICARVL